MCKSEVNSKASNEHNQVPRAQINESHCSKAFLKWLSRNVSGNYDLSHNLKFEKWKIWILAHTQHNNLLTSLGRSPAGPGNFLFAIGWRLSGVTGNDGASLSYLLFTLVMGVELFITCDPTNNELESTLCTVLLGVDGIGWCMLDLCWVLLKLAISLSDAGFFEGGRLSESVATLRLLREKANVFSFWLDEDTDKLHLGDLSPPAETWLCTCSSGKRWVLTSSEGSLTWVNFDVALCTGVVVFQHSSSSKKSCTVTNRSYTQCAYTNSHHYNS